MITIEGQDFYNYAEALFYLFSLYEDIYTKEEVDEIISNLPTGITEEQVQMLINNALTIYTTKEELNAAINQINTNISEIEEELTTKLTAAQVRDIVDEELGVIVNGRY